MTKKNVLGLIMMLVLAVVVTGCGVKTRAYIDDRERVDIQPTGNAGYLMGTPPPDAGKVDKKTRKVFVLEVTKDTPEDPVIEQLSHEIESRDVVVNTKRTYQESSTRSVTSSSPGQELQLPAITDDDFYVDANDDTNEGTARVVDYVVEKNDTLQKISKKFYGSYSKWTKIYDANKNVISDPNFLKPGTALKIHLGE